MFTRGKPTIFIPDSAKSNAEVLVLNLVLSVQLINETAVVLIIANAIARSQDTRDHALGPRRKTELDRLL